MMREADMLGAKAHVSISYIDGTYNVQAETYGETKEAARKIASDILCFLAQDRVAFIRCEPQADSWTDFDTQVTRHCGLVRFAFRDEPGKWQRLEGEESELSVGLGQAK